MQRHENVRRGREASDFNNWPRLKLRRKTNKKKDVNSPLEQSSPPQPGSHWQVSGETHRPWAHSSVHNAEEEDEDTKVDIKLYFKYVWLCLLNFDQRQRPCWSQLTVTVGASTVIRCHRPLHDVYVSVIYSCQKLSASQIQKNESDYYSEPQLLIKVSLKDSFTFETLSKNTSKQTFF